MNKHVVLGISGGIAAYKSATLVSRLAQAGVRVSVVMTEAARKFVAPDTLSALSGQPVALSMFGDSRYPLGAHITLAEQADLLCVAPATANFLSKAAQGLADDLLTTIYLAATCPVIIAPAMNSAMWRHAAVQRNVAQLQQDGLTMIPPSAGWLSCRVEGVGRMAEPEDIAATVVDRLTE